MGADATPPPLSARERCRTLDTITVYVYHLPGPMGRLGAPDCHSFTEPDPADLDGDRHGKRTAVTTRRAVISVPPGSALVTGGAGGTYLLSWSRRGYRHRDGAEAVLGYAEDGQFGFGTDPGPSAAKGKSAKATW